MSTAFVSQQATFRSSMSTNSCDISFTVPSGLTNAILMYWVDFWNPDTGLDPGVCTAMTWNGAGMTRTWDGVNTGYHRMTMGYVLNPSAGTFTLHATANRNCQAHGVAVLFSGVNQTTPISYTMGSTTVSGTISSVVIGQYLVDYFMSSQPGGGVSPATGQTVVYAKNDGTTYGDLDVGYQLATALTLNTITWTSPYAVIWHKAVQLNWDTAPVAPSTFIPRAYLY